MCSRLQQSQTNTEVSTKRAMSSPSKNSRGEVEPGQKRYYRQNGHRNRENLLQWSKVTCANILISNNYAGEQGTQISGEIHLYVRNSVAAPEGQEPQPPELSSIIKLLKDTWHNAPPNVTR